LLGAGAAGCGGVGQVDRPEQRGRDGVGLRRVEQRADAGPVDDLGASAVRARDDRGPAGERLTSTRPNASACDVSTVTDAAL